MSVAVPLNTWIQPVAGRWSIAANWSGGVPVHGQDVVVAPATPELLAFNIANFGVGAFTLQGATLQLNRGCLTVNRGATLKSATIAGSQSLIVSGTSTVSAVTVVDSAELRNRGTVTQSGGALVVGTQAEVVNLAGATWIDADGSAITATGGYGFVNFGLFRESRSAGVTTISAHFKSTGTVSVAAGGTLAFTAPGWQTLLEGSIQGGGAVEYGPGAVVRLGELTVTATNQTNLGAVYQIGALTLNGGHTIENLGQWNLNADVSILAGDGGGTILGPGVLAKTGGTGVSVVGAGVNLSGGVNVATGTLDFTGALNAFAGPIFGAGTFEIGAGVSQFAPGGSNTELISAAHFLLSGGTAQIVGAVTDLGAFEGDAGATLALGESPVAGGANVGSLSLGGPAVFSGLDVVGLSGANHPSQLAIWSTAAVSRLTLGGSVNLFDRGSVTQAGGSVTLGDSVSTDAASLTLAYGGVWNVADASGIALGADPGSTIDIGYNGTVGLFEKTGGGTSVIAPIVVNNSANVATNGEVYEGVAVSAGTLDFRNVVAGTGSADIVGAATLQFDNAVSAGQTVSFLGTGGTLELNAPNNFAAAIVGFDTTGAADTLLIDAGGYTYAGATVTATAATLAFSEGTQSFSLTLTGDYQGGAFTAQKLADGHTKITY